MEGLGSCWEFAFCVCRVRVDRTDLKFSTPPKRYLARPSPDRKFEKFYDSDGVPYFLPRLSSCQQSQAHGISIGACVGNWTPPTAKTKSSRTLTLDALES